MDIGSWRCPVCGEMVEGERVADDTLPARINAHKATHFDAREFVQDAMVRMDNIRNVFPNYHFQEARNAAINAAISEFVAKLLPHLKAVEQPPARSRP